MRSRLIVYPDPKSNVKRDTVEFVERPRHSDDRLVPENPRNATENPRNATHQKSGNRRCDAAPRVKQANVSIAPNPL